MSEGPTTAGSIVGKLRLDKIQWDADVAKAKADARELGASEPTVKVDANVAEALAKLESVRIAEDRIGGTTTRTVRYDSDAALQAAQQAVLATAFGRADAAIEKLRRDQEADNEAMRQGSIQALKESIMMEALSAAERNAADGAVKHTEAQKQMRSAADETSSSFNGLRGHTALIVAGIAALIPLAAPLAGFAVGVGGAMAAMGTAGVLALLGIGHEMQADTELGNQFQDGLAQVKDDLHQLEATAAAGVIKPFNEALAYLQPQMPRINQDMGAMSHWLGMIAATSVRTVVSGFEALEPLLVAGSKVLGDWANNMALFAGSTQFREFIQYAVGQVPAVNSLLINLGGLVVHLVDAFTPLGTVAIPVLSAMAFAFNAIPTPIITGLATGIGAVAAAFLVWHFAIQPIQASLARVAGASATVAVTAGEAAVAEGEAAAATTAWGAALDFALGPVGIVIGLVAALVGGMIAFSSSTSAAAGAQDDFTAAIQADNGAIRDHVAAQAAKKLADQGAYTAATQLGIANDTVTRAVLGQGNSYKSLKTQLDQIVSSSKLTAGAHQGNATALTSEGKAAQNLLGQIKHLKTELDGQLTTNQQFAGAAIAAGDAAQALAADENTLEDASRKADSATQGYIDALDKYGKSAGTAADKGAFLGASLVAMQGDWLSYDGALANAAFANYTLTQTFQDQGKQVSQGVKFLRDTEKAAIDLNTGLIDVSQSGAPALISQLQGMQSAAEKAAEATYTHEVATKGAGQAAADAAAVFKGDTYDALVKDADQLNITADQAKKLGDRYFGMPKDVLTKLRTDGQASVVQTLDGIGQQLAEISGHPWTSTLDANGVPLSHEAYVAQLKLNSIKQLNPTDIKADAAKAHMTVAQFTAYLLAQPNKDVTVSAETAAAEANVAAIAAHIAALQDRIVHVTVATNSVGAPVNTAVPTSGGNKVYADGGTVTGTGGPKADTVAAHLSVGEEVTPNPQSGRYRATLKALAADDVAGARRSLGGGQAQVIHHHITNNFTVLANDPTELTQKVSMLQNRKAAV